MKNKKIIVQSTSGGSQNTGAGGNGGGGGWGGTTYPSVDPVTERLKSLEARVAKLEKLIRILNIRLELNLGEDI